MPYGAGRRRWRPTTRSGAGWTGGNTVKEHHDNFIACIRDRKTPAANAEQGHYSALLCHLANASLRVGNKKLAFDGKTETFPGSPEANKFLKRASYREPWVVPDKV